MRNRFKKIFKGGLFFGIYYSGLLHLLIAILKRLRGKHSTIILFYHRFCNNKSDGYQLPELDIKEFRKQMEHIKKWYKVISMDELVKGLVDGNIFRLPSVIISIDDGYLNNYRLAYPVVKELDLPVIIYLTTGLIGTENATWVDDLMDIFLETKMKSLSFPELLGDEVLDISSHPRKRAAVTKFFQILIGIGHGEKKRTMEQLRETLGVKGNCRKKGERKMLNWNEVMEMSKYSISFGAHTVTHPILSRMSLEEGKHEIYDSIKEVEEKVGVKVKHFAIPNGKAEDFSEELKRFCKGIGILTIASTEPGRVSADSDPHFLRRIIPTPPMHVFACELVRYLFFRRRE